MSEKELIILGTGASRVHCPFDCEVWGVNAVYTQKEQRESKGEIFRLDKLFITDYLWAPRGTLHFDLRRVNRVATEFKTEIISLHTIRLGKCKLKTKRYPFWRIVRKFGVDYFTSTICHMLAYAIDKATVRIGNMLVLRPDAFTKLRLYGVDMITSQEYLLQKGGVEFWLGFAKGLGMEYTISEGAAVMKTPSGLPYGLKPKVDLKQVDPYNILSLRKK